MKYYAQAPIKLMYRLGFKQMGILANHWQQLDDRWKNLIKSQVTNIFVDNMVFEGYPIPEEDYINVINELMPNRFILPDAFGDLQETFRLHAKWFDKINDELKPNAIAVVNDFLTPDYYRWLKDNKIEHLAIPYFNNFARSNILDNICIKDEIFDFHLLGMESLNDFILYSYLQYVFNIKSCDSTILYTTSKHKVRFSTGHYVKDAISSDALDDTDIDDTIFLENAEYLTQFFNWDVSGLR